DAPFSVKITEGTYQVDASVDLDATWARGALQYAHLIVRAPTQSALALEASYKMNATAAVEPWKDTIFESRRPFAGSIGFVPVAGYVSIMLEAEVSAAVEGTVAVTGGVRESSVLQAGARYRNGAIEPVYSYQPTRTVIPVDIAGKGSSHLSVTLKPVIAVRFYGMVGPFVETPAFVKFEQEIAASLTGNGGTWKQALMAGVDARIGGSFDVFTRRVGQLSWNFEGPRWTLYADSGTFFRDSVAITPDTVDPLTMGDTLRLRASVWDHMKRLQPGARVSWRSGSQYLSVDTTGLVRTIAEGTGIIIAEHDGVADTARIQVGLPSVATDVDTLEITAGGYTPARVIARALDARSREIPGSRVVWRSGRWDYVAVDSLGNVTGLQEGYASVEARYTTPDGQYSVVKVVPVIIRAPRVVIGDAQGVPFPGDTVPTLTTGYIDGRLTATAYDHGNQPVPGARFTWRSNNASTVAVDSTGRVTGRDEGGANIIVTLFARDLPQPVAQGEVLVHTRLPTVRISPDANVPVLTAGFDTLQLTATAFDAHGQPLPGAGFRWSSYDTQTLTVDSTGLVRSTHFAGGTYIVATTWRPDGTAPGVRGEVLVTSGLPAVEIVQDSVPLLTTGMDTYQLSARGFDVRGHEIPGARFRWSVNDQTTLVVDSTGLVKTAYNAGTGQVTVTLR
ncbi:MAG TPA: Ig-like domain-containing protein, partial [Longimicrobium sp.]|nr:Ig-like domain-containing protein [Longimicrobium sp.]